MRVTQRQHPEAESMPNGTWEDIASEKGVIGTDGRGGRRLEGLNRKTAQQKQPDYKTVGWKESCGCELKWMLNPKRKQLIKDRDWKPIPCTVLDPFAGSCRALIVAKKLGRRGIGIDLKGEYLDMPKKELSQEMMEFRG